MFQLINCQRSLQKSPDCPFKEESHLKTGTKNIFSFYLLKHQIKDHFWGHFVFFSKPTEPSVRVYYVVKPRAEQAGLKPPPFPLQVQVWAGDLMWTNSTAACTQAETSKQCRHVELRRPPLLGKCQRHKHTFTTGWKKTKQTSVAHADTRGRSKEILFSQTTSRTSSNGTQASVIYSGNTVKQLH